MIHTLTLTLLLTATGLVVAAPPPDEPTAQMQAVLDELKALSGKPIPHCTPAEARKQPTPADAVKALLKKKGKKVEPEAVGSVKDITYPAASGELPARVYTPKGDGPFPVLAYWHGGWVIADIDTYDSSCRALCNAAKCVVVSFEYRHALEHPFPAAAEDAVAAYRWLVGNAGKYNGDPKRVAVGGESAGGNLAAVVALKSRDGNLPKPVHQLLVYPVTGNNIDTPSYKQYADARPLNESMMRWFFAHYVGNQPEAAGNPMAFPRLAADLSGLPPATILNAEIDPLRDDGTLYADKLKAAGVNVTQKTYPGVTHEFFGIGAVLDTAKEAAADAAAALKTAFAK